MSETESRTLVRSDKIRVPGTRARILQAAAHLFHTRGFHATTTRAISEIVGILSGSLFHYFKSKEQILFEVMNDAATSLCSKADAAIARASPDPRAQLQALIRMQLDSLLSKHTRDFIAVLIAEWREVDQANSDILTTHRKRYTATWLSVLANCERAGLLRGDPQATLFTLHGAINWASSWFNPEGRLSLDEYANLLERMALRDVAHVAS